MGEGHLPLSEEVGTKAELYLMHKEVKIRPFWYTDMWVFPKLITVITTLDKKGRVNAAPYSHIMQYDVMQKTPRMMVGFRQDSHTFTNIVETGEFVINCPSADYLDDMMETARFWPEGVNELEHTKFTTVPSKYVKPPTIAECPQVMECTVDEIITLHKSSGLVIANIKAILMQEELIDMPRKERLPAMNLPIGLGDESRRLYYHMAGGHISEHELMEPPQGLQGGKIEFSMQWDSDAQKQMMRIPVGVREMVVKNTEQAAREKGEEMVSSQFFKDLSAEFGITDELLERFES